MKDEVQLRRLFEVISGGTPSADPENWNGSVTWVTPADLGHATTVQITSSARTLTEEGLRSGSSQVPEKSIVISIRAPIGHVAIAAVPTAFNQGCKGLVPRERLDERFFYYQLLAKRLELKARGQGSTFKELSSENLSSFRVKVPALNVQRLTADFLDRQCARLDKSIALKRSLLSKLPVRMAAVTQAMLAPLPRNARLGFAVRWLSGGTPARKDPANWIGDMPWVSSKDLHSDRLSDAQEHIDERAAETSSTIAPASSVLVSTRGMSLAKRLPFALIERPMAFNQDLKGLVPVDPLDGEYLRIVLRSFEPEILSSVVESAHGTKRLKTQHLKALKFPLPTPKKQRSLVAEVTEAEIENSQLIDRIRRHIDLLNQRRVALISVAIDGSIDPSSFRESAI